MGTVFRKISTRPIPNGAEITLRNGKPFARWRVWGKLRTAPLIESSSAIRQESAT
jgi:hypothetical protein